MNLDVPFKVGVILPAAGSGERLGGGGPKQYLDILDKPIFLYTVEALLQFDWVTQIVLAADDVQKMKHLLSNHDVSKIKVILGGATRHSSIKAALTAIPDDCEVVVVHDAVRPFVPYGILQELVISAKKHGAAGPTRPLISTVVQPDEKGFLQKTLNRAQFLNSETPQAFRTSVLREAYNKITAEEEVHGTECLQLVSVHCNVQAKLIPGPVELWKVTVARDLHTCEGELSAHLSHIGVTCDSEGGENQILASALVSSLSWRAAEVRKINSFEDLFKFNRRIIFISSLSKIVSINHKLPSDDGVTVLVLCNEIEKDLCELRKSLKISHSVLIFVVKIHNLSALNNLIASIIKFPVAFYGQILTV